MDGVEGGKGGARQGTCGGDGVKSPRSLVYRPRPLPSRLLLKVGGWEGGGGGPVRAKMRCDMGEKGVSETCLMLLYDEPRARLPQRRRRIRRRLVEPPPPTAVITQAHLEASSFAAEGGGGG